MKPQTVNILLVEDNQDHALLIKEALEEHGKNKKIHAVYSGMDALDFLYNRNQFKDNIACPCPDLILLDMKLPKLSGLEVLKKIKSDQRLKKIPVIVVSSSFRQVDILAAYAAGVNSYVGKPIDFEDFVNKIEQIESYWFHINTLPTARTSF